MNQRSLLVAQPLAIRRVGNQRDRDGGNFHIRADRHLTSIFPFSRVLYSSRRASVATEKRFQRVLVLQPRPSLASIKGYRMDEDVQQLLRRKRYAEALEELLNRYEIKVFRMAVTFLKDPSRAEEVTQDIFLNLWQALPYY